MTDEDERYFRDIYDHLIRISDLIDTYRDLLTSSMDVYLSTVSNRLNTVMKQLTIIATIFLPLSWHHRLLRPELRLDGPPHRGLGSLPRPRHRPRGVRAAVAARILQVAALVLTSEERRWPAAPCRTLSDVLDSVWAVGRLILGPLTVAVFTAVELSH